MKGEEWEEWKPCPNRLSFCSFGDIEPSRWQLSLTNKNTETLTDREKLNFAFIALEYEKLSSEHVDYKFHLEIGDKTYQDKDKVTMMMRTKIEDQAF